MRNDNPVWSHVDAKGPEFTGLADRVFDTPELAYTEKKSCAAHTEMLEAQGFRVTRNVAGIPTAVMGEAGEGGPVIAILGEYDALPGLSQEPGLAEPRQIADHGFGHGCGHNLLGSAALSAATAVKDWLAAEGLPGRVRYFGCPAEEGGAAKTYMVRDGQFDDVDIAITWHPASFNAVDDMRSLANTRIDFTFHGKAAHAAGAPELGRSALDSVELMNIGVNYMREHMPDAARVHYAYLDAGGIAPNVVQSKATVRQLIRSPDLAGLQSLVERVRNIADGAALMSGTTVTSKVFSAVSNLTENRPLSEAMQAEFEALGPVPFDEADEEFGSRIRSTLTRDDIADTFQRLAMKPDYDKTMCDFIAPLDRPFMGGIGSTDVGDVSWAVPTVQARVATCAIGTALHSWQQTAQGKAPAAHKGMLHAAKVMASTARAALIDPDLIARAKAAHREHLADFPYACPIPEGTNPPVEV
ncbi:M20 family metallopeptidase [Paracoccus sp. 1_MG-2023]|uniref:M20 family metallopeptidase n=1 Tax=unclassified Paracoccus (in: a-proteobacteria) TaxID=2688777 RepID=UPI001C08021F|nr:MULTISPECIES: M20 family metallopeptidase [unclassified Paracoccus (in: a-proteobacteria)]MBU2958442.1 amidohydrolase [Paracoccus sp. C2R09]MDO6668573.1 M20 family metallopeptidase [Paracoccus sp. 1_MG-2023]